MAKFFFTQTQNVELVVEGGKPLGGSVVETMVWMKALHELGHEVYLAKFEEDSREKFPFYDWVNLIPIYHSKKFKKRLVWFSYRFPSMYLVFKRIKPDYVYTAIPTWSGFYVGLICKLLGIKHIIRVANDPEVEFSLNPTYPFHHKKLINASYRMADVVLAQNVFQFDILKKRFPKTKISKVFNPIFLDKEFLKTKVQFEGYIAWIANFRYQKNLRLLYEVALLFPLEKFKVAGQPLLPLDNETEFYLGKLKELKNVEFVGSIPRNKILEFLNQAKFLLSTSRYEGFSNTFLESMIVGTPILTTPSVNPDGIIDNFNLGYIYNDARDLKIVFENIEIDDYIKKSHNCVSYVRENHDHIQLGGKVLDFLKSI